MRRYFLTLLFFTTVAFFYFGGEKPQMKTHVYIAASNSKIYLSDFFSIEQLSETDYKRLSSYVFGFAPLVGKTIEFDTDYVVGKLNYNFPDFVYSEAETENILVTKGVNSENPVEICINTGTEKSEFDLEIAKNMITEYFLCEYMKFEGEELADSQEFTEFDFEEAEQFKISGDSSRINISKYGNNEYIATFSIYSENRFISSVRIKFEARWLRNLAVADRNINYGEVLGQDLISFQKEDFISNKESIPESDFSFGYIAKNYIREGQLVRKASVKPPPYVLRGQVIQAIVDMKSVTVNVKVKLLSDGAIGDIVKAMNVESGAIISGVLEEGPVLKVNY